MVSKNQERPIPLVDVSSVGETMALMREINSSNGTPTFELGFGGAESNVMTQCARLGLKTRWTSALGGDSFGEQIRTGLESQNIEVVLANQNKYQTGLMVKTYAQSLDPIVVYYRSNSAASHLQLNENLMRRILSSKILHMTGIFPAISDIALEVTRKILSQAQAAGVLISFDVNFRPRLWSRDSASKVLGSLWECADFIFGDRDELELLIENRTFDDDRDLMEAISNNSRVVVLKKGAEGAAALSGGEFSKLQAHPARVIDTVGAGDAFVGGFLSGVIGGKNTRGCLELAVTCGAKACEHFGDWEGQLVSI